MKHNKFLSILASVAVAGTGLLSTSCADDLDLKPIDYPSANSFWATQTQFEGNLTANMNMFRGNYDRTIMFGAGEERGGYITMQYLDGSTIADQYVVDNTLTPANPQFGNFANFYGFISNLNLWIYEADKVGDNVLTPEAKAYMSGMAYGMRAYAYFQLHKMYGTCPLRTEPDVVLGDYNPTNLYRPRASAETILNLIKDDLAKSIQGFKDGASYSNSIFNASNGVYYWNEAATKMLAGEVYMWSGKVSTDDHKANPSDVTTAKQYFQSVVNDYNYALQSNYYDIWKIKANSEVIFSTYGDRNEYTSSYDFSYYFCFSTTTGGGKGTYWWMRGNAADTPGFNAAAATGPDVLLPYSPDATRLGYTAAGPGNPTAFFNVAPNRVNRYQVKNALVRQMKDEDQRTQSFIKVYLITPEDASLNEIKNFDADTATLAGAYMYKIPGQNGQNSPYQIVAGNDVVFYRLPLAYFYLAEIANFEGNNADVEKYINLVRQRAFADNWDEATFGYKAGSFTENEVAILQEKTREFLFEGQRWWDLRRLTAVKNGSDADHLVFRPEGCVGYGLNRADFKCNHWNEVSENWTQALNSSNQIETNVPVLDYALKSYMVLWPLDLDLMASDPEITQTPGY